MRKRRFRAGKNGFDKIPVVFGAHLLRDKQPAGPQQTVKLGRVLVPVAVEDQIKRRVRKRNVRYVAAFAQIDAERRKPFPAELHVRRVALRGCRVFIRMPQRQQELAAARVVIEQLHFIFQGFAHDRLVIPGQILFLRVTAADVRKIPALDAGAAFLSLPDGSQFIRRHESASLFFTRPPPDRRASERRYRRPAAAF